MNITVRVFLTAGAVGLAWWLGLSLFLRQQIPGLIEFSNVREPGPWSPSGVLTGVALAMFSSLLAAVPFRRSLLNTQWPIGYGSAVLHVLAGSVIYAFGVMCLSFYLNNPADVVAKNAPKFVFGATMLSLLYGPLMALIFFPATFLPALVAVWSLRRTTPLHTESEPAARRADGATDAS